SAARYDHFQGHPVAHLHAPPFGGEVTDFFNNSHRFVTRNEGTTVAAHVAAVRFDVATADGVGLNFEQCVIGTDLGAGELLDLDLAGAELDRGAHHIAHIFLICWVDVVL